MRDISTAALGGAALAACVFGLGGALRWCQALVAFLVVLALVPMFLSRRGLARLSPLLAGLALATALTALQLLPVTEGGRAALDPVGATLRAEGVALLDTAPWPSMTRDPAGTWRALAGFIVLLGIAAIALRVAVTERGRYLVLACVAGLSGLAAACVGLHEVLGAEKLYGLYAPEHAGPHLLGPLLNLNHLGGLMAIGAVVAIGLAAYPRQPTWLRATWVLVATMTSLVAVMTVSRGATLALGLGCVVVIGLLVIQRFAGAEIPRRRRGELLTRSIPIGVVAICSIVVIVYFGATNVGRQLSQTSLRELSQPTSKFAAWRSATTLVEESPWIGVGRGAFEPSFTHAHPASGRLTFSHVENEYLQAVVDWGVPGAIALGLVMIWLAVVCVRRWRDGPLAAGALAAIAAIAAQSNVDFGLELFGIAAPMIAVAATLAYVPLRELEPRVLARRRAVRGVHVAAMLGAGALLISPLTTSIDEDHQAMRDAPSFATIRASAERHPLDYYSFAVAAELLARRGDPRGVLLLNHALALNPTHGGLHRLAAHMLFRGGHVAQAAIEYEHALRSAANPRALLAEITAVLPAQLAASAIPRDFRDPEEMIGMLVELGRLRVISAWLARALTEQLPGPRMCDMVFAQVSRAHDLALVRDAGAKCMKATFAPEVAVRLDIARMFHREKHPEDVRDLLGNVERWTAHADIKREAWFLQCDVLAEIAPWDDAKRCLRHLEMSGLAGGDHAQQLAARLEQLEARRTRLAPVPSTPAPSTPVPRPPVP